MAEQIDQSKRALVKGGGLAGLAALLFGPACVANHLDMWSRSHAERFGTVEAPVYSLLDIAQDEQMSKLENLALPGLLEQSFGEIESLIEENKALYGKLEQELAGNPDYRGAARILLKSMDMKRSCLKISIALSKLLRKRLGQSIERLGYAVDTENEGLRRELPEPVLARQLFMEMTGRQFPEGVAIKKEEKLQDAMGIHSSVRGIISYEDIQYVENMATLLHENGHVCAQHNEQLPYKQRMIKAKAGEVTDAAILEEACAYSFENASAHVIAKRDEKLAKVLKLGFEGNMYGSQEELYEEPEKYMNSPHSRGAELFVAARQVLKDPSKVFNYLATLKGSDLRNLDPKIKAQLQKNRGLWKSWQNQAEEIKYLIGQTDELEQKYDALLKKSEQYLESVKP